MNPLDSADAHQSTPKNRAALSPNALTHRVSRHGLSAHRDTNEQQPIAETSGRQDRLLEALGMRVAIDRTPDADTRARIVADAAQYTAPDDSRAEPNRLGSFDDWSHKLDSRDRRYLANRANAPLVAADRGVWTATSYEEIEHLGPWPADEIIRYTDQPKRMPEILQGVESLMRSGQSFMVIPMYSTADRDRPTFYQLRADPKLRRQDKDSDVEAIKELKFINPLGAKRGLAPGCIAPDLHPMLAPDDEVPLVITEGVMKADALLTAALREGIAVHPVALTGVTMGYLAADSADNPLLDPVLAPSLRDSFKMANRLVYVCWDHDWRINRGVRDPLITTGRLIESAGAVVQVIDVPMVRKDAKAGVDDYLAWALLENARSGTHLNPLSDLLANSLTLDEAEWQTRAYPHTDHGRGQRILDEVTRLGTFLQNIDTGSSIVWTGRKWEPDPNHRSLDALGYDLAYRDPEDTRGTAAMAVQHAVKQVLASSKVSRRERDFDVDPWLLNTPSGTIDLLSCDLLPHSPRHMLTGMAGAGYDPALLEAPDYGSAQWAEFLEAIQPDPDVRRYLQLLAGTFLTSKVFSERMHQFYGTGGNGKGVLLNVINGVMGSYSTTIDSSVLTSPKTPIEQNVPLVGARLAVTQETAPGEKLNTKTLKALASRDALPARRLYENQFVFQPSHKLLMSTNHELRINATDNGTWRRMILVPFEQTFTEGDTEDEDLTERLLLEAPSVLAWMVDGLRMLLLQNNKMPLPQHVANATAEYRVGEDPIAGFINERLVFGARLRLNQAHLFPEYEDWCEEDGRDHRMTRTRLLKTLREHRDFVGTTWSPSNSVDWVHGVALKDTQAANQRRDLF